MPIDEPTPEQAAMIARTLDRIRASHNDAPDSALEGLQRQVAPFPWSSAEIMLKARSDLGNLALLASRPRQAILQFRAVLERSSEPSADIRARALYGLAQAHRQLGENTTAERYFLRLGREYEGTVYADYARTGLGQIHSSGSDGVQVGRTAPRFEVLDTKQRAVSFDALLNPQGRNPVLLVFWKPRHAESVDLLAQLTQVWIARQPADNCIAFALESKRDEIDASAAAESGIRLVHCDREFAEPVAISYGVDVVPTHFLIGPNGMLLARNPSAEQLADILGHFR